MHLIGCLVMSNKYGGNLKKHQNAVASDLLNMSIVFAKSQIENQIITLGTCGRDIYSLKFWYDDNQGDPLYSVIRDETGSDAWLWTWTQGQTFEFKYGAKVVFEIVCYKGGDGGSRPSFDLSTITYSQSESTDGNKVTFVATITNITKSGTLTFTNLYVAPY